MSETLTIDARTFRFLLEPILPLASKDSMTPLLTAVLIRSDGITVTAEATDRFRLGICRANLTDMGAERDQTEFKALIRVTDLKRIMGLFKVTRFDNPVTQITHADGMITAESTEGFGDIAGASLTVTALDASGYPDLHALIRKALASNGERVDSFSINVAQFADFKHAVSRGSALSVRAGAAQKDPIVVQTDNFIGLLVPKRSPDFAWSTAAASWEPLLVAPAKVGTEGAGGAS